MRAEGFREIPKSEVPPDILAKSRGRRETDITNEMELMTGTSIS